MNLIYNNKTPVGINYNNNEVETLNYNDEPVWENTPYEELEYIKSTGTQFIDTGIPARTNTSIEVDAKLNAINNRTTMMGNWGTRENDDLRWCVYFHNDNRLYFYISTSNYSWVWSSNAGNRMTYKIDHNKFYVNGNLYKDFTSRGNIDTQKNALIFTASSDGSDACYMTLYACKVWENDVLVRDFIPVRRKSDNEICLYDKLTEEFYTNRGTGSFSAGPEKKAKISDFKILDYIQSEGNQFIDINYIPKTLHTKYELGFMRTGTHGLWNPIINSEEDVRFGIMCTTSGTDRFNKGQFHIGSTSEFKSVQFPITDNVKYDMIADKTGISVNNTKYDLEGVVNATGQWSTCINHRKNSSSGYSSEYSLGRWYYLKIYEDNELIKDFVPVKRIYDDELGVFDRINNNFYVNNGTGEFTAGPEI